MPMFEAPALLGLIALPALAPLLALIQFLFPGLLGDHWRHYRSMIAALMSQSTLMFAQWVALTWFVKEPTWWLTDRALAWGMTGVAAAGLLGSLFIRPRPAPVAPVRVEFIALGIFGGVSGAWLLWQGLHGAALLDYVLIATLACAAGLVHLLLRMYWSRGNRRAGFATETICLMLFASGGGLLNGYIYDGAQVANELASVTGEWTTYRGSVERTGTGDTGDKGPSEPQLLWTFTPPLKRGEAHLDSSPVVVDGLVFASGYSQVLAYRQGIVWCVNAQAGRRVGTQTLAAGELVWQTNDESLRPIYSSPTVLGEKLLLGEGYHFDANCRLMALDARSGHEQWSFKTASHVESTPTLVNGRVYFGAGDDGLYCLERPERSAAEPRVVWHVKGIHSDASPLVADGRVFAGGVVGEVVNDLQILAVDTATGDEAWRVPTDLPVPAALSYHDGGVLASLGNGKMNQEHAKPQGAVWRLSAATGDRQWEFPLSSSVLTSPIVNGERVYFVARSGACYALDAKTGARIWQVDLNEPVVAAPIVSGGRMFVVSCWGTVHALDTSNGASVWSLDKLKNSTQEAYSSPVLVEGKLYLAIGGKLHCLGDVTRP
jgi:outer membrane protein assembly factor BamB